MGVIIFTGKSGDIKKILLHPCLIAIYLGLLVMITGFTPLALVSRIIFSLGGCSTPVSLIVIGNIFGLVELGNLVTKLTAGYTLSGCF